MAKQTVINTCNQPLYLNLFGGRSMKIRARSTAEVEEEYLHSPEIDFQRNRGNIVILEKREATRPKDAETKKEAEAKKDAEAKKKAEVKKEAKLR